MKSIIRARKLSACILGVAISASPAYGDFYWVGTSGSWNDPANWSTTDGGPGGAGVPNGDWVFVRPTDAVNRTILVAPTTDPALTSRFEAGAIGGGSLIFNITQGSFGDINAQMLVGYSGQAGFVQTGGDVKGGFEFGSSTADALGTYDLSGGSFQSSFMRLGSGGQGIFRQSGGAASVSGMSISSTSRYELSGGSLVTDYDNSQGYSMELDGSFLQSGGLHTVERLNVYGNYEWTGGSLQINKRLGISGQFTFPTTAVTMNIDGIVDLSSPAMTLTNAGNVALNLTDTSLLIRSASFNPATVFGSFSNPGFTHIAGNTLTVFPGRTLKLLGEFDDRVDVFGSIIPTTDDDFSLNGGITLRDGASIDTSGGVVRIRSGDSLVQGGQLLTGYLGIEGSSFLPIPPSIPAVMRQLGGTVECFDLAVGVRSRGTYELSGGVLTSRTAIVGATGPFLSPFGGSGSMHQTGGLHTVNGPLMIGRGENSTGVYTLGGGHLHVQTLQVSAPVLSGFGFPPQPPTYGDGELDITDNAADIRISHQLSFGPNSIYNAVSGTIIHMTGAGGIPNQNTNADDLAGLLNTTFVFESGTTDMAWLEAAGNDLGATLAGFSSNFVIDTLQIGGSDIGAVMLVDEFQNHLLESEIAEAMYVNTLILNAGSYLLLDEINLYCLNYINNGGTLFLAGGAQLAVVPEPAVLLPLAVLGLLHRRTRQSRF